MLAPAAAAASSPAPYGLPLANLAMLKRRHDRALAFNPLNEDRAFRPRSLAPYRAIFPCKSILAGILGSAFLAGMRLMLFGGLTGSEPALLFKRRHFWHREARRKGRGHAQWPCPAFMDARQSGKAMLHTIAAFDRLGEENAFAVLARATALASQGRDIINLGIGQPDFPTPPHIVEAAVKALRDGHHGYTPATGILPLREAVARDSKNAGVLRGLARRVIVVPGGKVTMFMAILMFGEPGVEILYPDPGFPIYRSMIEFTGATPYRYRSARRTVLPSRPPRHFADRGRERASSSSTRRRTRPAGSRRRPRSTRSSPGSSAIPTSPSCPTRSTPDDL